MKTLLLLNFIKKIDFPFVQKTKAEEVLYNALETVASENNAKDQEDSQIKSNVLDEHIIESDLLLKRNRQNSGEEFSTPLNKVRIFETGYDSDLGLYNGESSSSDSETVPKLLTNVFLEIKDSGVGDDDNILEFVDNYDDNVDIDEQTPIPEPDINGYGKPLSIDVANFHNNSCIQTLPSSMITYIQKQMENDDDNTIYFDNEKKIGTDKFAIDIEDEVMEFLNKFRDCVCLHVYCTIKDCQIKPTLFYRFVRYIASNSAQEFSP
ncbi:34587_t:CDS:2 [Gigaspora margarita]|uniref:34587_t:CDS:1 n=1 Tax=Gigaspora margarita TaxID=4874 RepID=A0ABN7UT38_GIGMA|nr:34587_t:CDS:2 [Gigaspora margarita]